MRRGQACFSEEAASRSGWTDPIAARGDVRGESWGKRDCPRLCRCILSRSVQGEMAMSRLQRGNRRADASRILISDRWAAKLCVPGSPQRASQALGKLHIHPAGGPDTPDTGRRAWSCNVPLARVREATLRSSLRPGWRSEEKAQLAALRADAVSREPSSLCQRRITSGALP